MIAPIVNPDKNSWNELQQRPAVNKETLNELVASIFNEVEQTGDEAVRKYNARYGGVSEVSLLVDEATITKACSLVSPALKKAIALAANNIQKFHESQKTPITFVETSKGITCWQKQTPIQKVGLYIPGGTAPLFSTVLMLGIPAKLAGCKEIVLCTPTDANGEIAPEILYTANFLGIKTIYKAGGIQAIAALVKGTKSVSAVNKIFGPGNQYVTAAKTFAQQAGVAIDMPAGPSELLVMADQTANPTFIAADLLSQAEHGADSQVILVTNSNNLLVAVNEELIKQLAMLPRKDIATKALNNGRFIAFNNEDEAMDFVNEYAPEHLILMGENEQKWANEVQNAGSVFIGKYSAESCGDYASGTNHTLPTAGFAKAYSGVNLASFTKSITFQEVSEVGLQVIGEAVEIMAEAEGLQAHKNAITVRLNSLNNEN
jgi:histidinol dehydrogenase